MLTSFLPAALEGHECAKKLLTHDERVNNQRDRPQAGTHAPRSAGRAHACCPRAVKQDQDTVDRRTQDTVPLSLAADLPPLFIEGYERLNLQISA